MNNFVDEILDGVKRGNFDKDDVKILIVNKSISDDTQISLTCFNIIWNLISRIL